MTSKNPVISVNQAAEKWGISRRRVNQLCQDGRVDGAYKLSARGWAIPSDTPKPCDARYGKRKGKGG